MVRWCLGKRCWAVGNGWWWPEPPSCSRCSPGARGAPGWLVVTPWLLLAPGCSLFPPSMVMSAGRWGDGEEGAKGGESCRAAMRRAKR